MSTTELQNRLARISVDGYCVIENLIPQEKICQIKDQLDTYFQGKKMGRNAFEGHHTERVYALLSKSTSMADLIEHPTILEMLDVLLPNNYLLSAALAINVHPGETPQPFHYDDSAGYLDLPKPRRAFGISTIWALDDFTEDNGATEVIPGSHHWTEQRQPKQSEVTKIVMPAGSVVVFDGTLVHRGGANRSKTTRLGITPQYCAPGLRQIENMVLAVAPKQAAKFSDKIQNMLGYNVIEPGFMGYVDGQHPKKLIDANYRGRKYQVDLPNS